MLRVSLPGDRQVSIKFTHDPNHGCLCEILSGKDKSLDEEKTLVAMARTKLHAGDNYDKEIGRKMSLERAMLKAKFEREDKALIWNYYGKAGNKIWASEPGSAAVRILLKTLRRVLQNPRVTGRRKAIIQTAYEALWECEYKNESNNDSGSVLSGS